MRIYSAEPYHAYLYEDQEEALEALDQQYGVPATELIRQAVDPFIGEYAKGSSLTGATSTGGIRGQYTTNRRSIG